MTCGPTLECVMRKMAGLKTGQVIVGWYCKPEPHENGSTWVSEGWLKKHFPDEYSYAVLSGTDEIEISQRKACEILTKWKPGCSEDILTNERTTPL